MKKSKLIITWISLIVLVILLLALNYIKFFGKVNQYIEEKPVENSASLAINNALTEIVNHFNQNTLIQEYEKENIKINAILKNYSIYISYSTENETTTYEFDYNNLILKISIENTKENLEKFQKIYKILIDACQKRLKNSMKSQEKIENIINGSIKWNGITKEEVNQLIFYQLDITKKIENE